MVWVNILWLISLVLSLTCALIVTLLQQWARRYIETPKSSNVQRNRARVRSLLLVGTKLYNNLSYDPQKVAIPVDVAVGVSGLAYLTLSILPCLDVRCPYRTPISQLPCIDVKCPFCTPISKILIVVSVASFPLLRSILPSIDYFMDGWLNLVLTMQCLAETDALRLVPDT
jgi:hypothetical protein